MTTEVIQDASMNRFELLVDGHGAGELDYQIRDNTIVITHTEIDPAFQGQGLAGKLASAALADAAERGDAIVPLCPYIAKYLETHEVPGAEIRWPKPPSAPAGSAGEDPTGRAE